MEHFSLGCLSLWLFCAWYLSYLHQVNAKRLFAPVQAVCSSDASVEKLLSWKCFKKILCVPELILPVQSVSSNRLQLFAPISWNRKSQSKLPHKAQVKSDNGKVNRAKKATSQGRNLPSSKWRSSSTGSSALASETKVVSKWATWSQQSCPNPGFALEFSHWSLQNWRHQSRLVLVVRREYIPERLPEEHSFRQETNIVINSFCRHLWTNLSVFAQHLHEPSTVINSFSCCLKILFLSLC